MCWPLVLLLGLLSSSCSNRLPEFADQPPVEVELTADGQTRDFTTSAGNVREFLVEADLVLGESDIIEPPLFTPITQGLEIRVVRVTESIETIQQSIPFQRKSVRNESMQAEDPPLIIQGGRPGLQEVTVRIVYHDGLEVDRQQTQVTVIDAAQDEIVMIGVGAAAGNVDFEGMLAYISSGSTVILRGSTIFPEQLNTGEGLDHRVFSLSPDGRHLLYTRVMTGTGTFNSLWVIGTERGARPESLQIDNVLWADWNPSKARLPEIAYTTGRATELLPGWEANNDLWVGALPLDDESDFEPEQLVEVYPATYGWWGGSYAWSPAGRYIAYSYADEVGVLDTRAVRDDQQRTQLQSFTEYNTRADWVWVPSLSWSPDGKYVVFTRHEGTDPDAPDFSTWVADVSGGIAGRFFEHTGIWSHPQWSPALDEPSELQHSASQIAFLKATNPLDSLRSSYTLWLMDRDGSNARQIYPPAGENSRFPREQQFMAWDASGDAIVFVYNQSLYLLSLDTGETRRITQDDASVSNPTWAPYGAGVIIESVRDEVDLEVTPGPRPGERQPLE